MAGGISLGSALQLLDGSPHRKAGSAFVEKIPFAKVLAGGGLGGLMQKVVGSGDLSGVMQNPVAAISGQLQGQLGGLVGRLQGMTGGGPAGLISAIQGPGGLGAALSGLVGSGDALAGLTGGGAGIFTLLGHESVARMAGEALPPQAGMDRVLGPLTAGADVANIQAGLGPLVDRVASGVTPPDTATAWVQARTADLNAIVAESEAAVAWGQEMQVMLSTVSTMAGALAVPPVIADGVRRERGASGFQSVLASLVRPEALRQMRQGVEAQIAHTKHAPIDVAALTALDA